MNILLIADTKGRRAEHFIKAMEKLEISYIFLPWKEFLLNRDKIEGLCSEDTIIRIEPPEKDIELYREFLKLGDSSRQWDNIDLTDFKIVSPSIWYKGFSLIMNELKEKNLKFMNHPEDILVMMDKKKTYEKLKDSMDGFSLAKSIENISSYEELKKRFGTKGAKVFIKLRYGSGGIGVIAYEYNPILKRERAYTTLKESKGSFYNTYKVSKYTSSEKIKPLIDWVISEGAHIEEWITKPRLKEKRFDVRGIYINGRLAYSLARLSTTPITNLHLKNERIAGDEVFTLEQKTRIEKALIGAMKSFPKSFYSGTDIIITEEKAYIIDVNPFGDLMHHLLESEENLYVKELKGILGN